MEKLKLVFTFFLVLITGLVSAQVTSVTISGVVRSKTDKTAQEFANVVVLNDKDNSFVAGTVTNEEGRFSIADIKPGNYILEISIIGFEDKKQPLFIGSLSEFLDLQSIELDEELMVLEGVTITGKANEVDNKMDKKTYSVADNISQMGGTVLQSMQNLPGVTVQDGRVSLRGSDKVMVLIDGKQTALTGFDSQRGLDQIPASAIDKIEIINNPTAKFDANGNAGIINIIMKKNQQEGFNGKAGLATGLGALWVRKQNLPSIDPQYTLTPKINPSLLLNYRKDKINIFLQADNLYTHTLNKNEFVTRIYDDGTHINSQFRRNRNTNFFTTKSGVDWAIDDRNTLSISGLYGSEKILDHGQQGFFNADISERLRLWKFLEDELKTTIMTSSAYQHKFKEAGHLLNIGFNYTFHRENEKYFYTNYLPNSIGTDAFKLISDQNVYDFNLDYIKPLKYGQIQTGVNFRYRKIPTDMEFIPGENSVLDFDAGGWAVYKEVIPALYGNYLFENEKWEAELGVRMEYVRVRYDVNPNHNTYKSDGYNYTQPFPNMRLAYKLNENNKFSIFYNRRVDRPNEGDIRIFPKYDDAEIIKVGNPALRPQYTNSMELGYKNTWNKGFLYTALYHRMADGTITRIASTVPGSNLIYNIFQNAGRSYNSGIEVILNEKFSNFYTFNINGNIYRNQINEFTVLNLYPEPNTFSADRQVAYSGNLKLNNTFRFAGGWDGLFTLVYLAPDIIPQGKTFSMFSIDTGVKKSIQNGKGEIFINASDLLNTMVSRREIQGKDFSFTLADYKETQVIRVGYSYKF